ncbi:hypothetical protein BC828DRAFT_380178 [Blastocladiella britannica]|nr:hypothetical protein BC828DRAFT_380178 [Blastocladiella britannica]
MVIPALSLPMYLGLGVALISTTLLVIYSARSAASAWCLGGSADAVDATTMEQGQVQSVDPTSSTCIGTDPRAIPLPDPLYAADHPCNMRQAAGFRITESRVPVPETAHHKPTIPQPQQQQGRHKRPTPTQQLTRMLTSVRRERSLRHHIQMQDLLAAQQRNMQHITLGLPQAPPPVHQARMPAAASPVSGRQAPTPVSIMSIAGGVHPPHEAARPGASPGSSSWAMPSKTPAVAPPIPSLSVTQQWASRARANASLRAAASASSSDISDANQGEQSARTDADVSSGPAPAVLIAADGADSLHDHDQRHGQEIGHAV